MSKSLGLVKFIDTGNIYMGVYDGTSDIFYSRIFTAEECYDKNKDCYNYFSYISDLFHENWTMKEPYNLSPVEIYSDYGRGFWWRGLGDENQKLIDYRSCDPWGASTDYCCNDDIKILHEVPEWAKNFMEEKFN